MDLSELLSTLRGDHLRCRVATYKSAIAGTHLISTRRWLLLSQRAEERPGGQNIARVAPAFDAAEDGIENADRLLRLAPLTT